MTTITARARRALAQQAQAQEGAVAAAVRAARAPLRRRRKGSWTGSGICFECWLHTWSLARSIHVDCNVGKLATSWLALTQLTPQHDPPRAQKLYRSADFGLHAAVVRLGGRSGCSSVCTGRGSARAHARTRTRNPCPDNLRSCACTCACTCSRCGCISCAITTRTRTRPSDSCRGPTSDHVH